MVTSTSGATYRLAEPTTANPGPASAKLRTQKQVKRQHSYDASSTSKTAKLRKASSEAPGQKSADTRSYWVNRVGASYCAYQAMLMIHATGKLRSSCTAISGCLKHVHSASQLSDSCGQLTVPELSAREWGLGKEAGAEWDADPTATVSSNT